MDKLTEIVQRYSVLDRDQRRHLVCWMVYEFSIEGRNSYVEAGRPEAEAIARLRGINEVMQVLSKQLLFLNGSADELAYPDEDFFAALLHWSGDTDVFLHAVYRAFRQILRLGLA